MFFKKDPMNAVELALQGRSWRYVRLDRETLLTGLINPLGGSMVLVVVRHDADKETLLFLFNPVKGEVGPLEAMMAGKPPFLCVHANEGHTPDQVAKVTELLLKTNYELVLGAFERDPADGEIRFRIALPYRNANPTVEQIGWCIEVGSASVMRGTQQVTQLLGTRMEI